ncbi:MAG: bifunctional GTP diphosphokinase/guanosine-3',5'-bis pyrophosphate 3'-pyrophosphohydrolase [Gammaproteobacteria bacterium]|nr:bifunctional GTP diphosphokinase/guanosine-3',5'-bis pyrophosphate 3'-pyrophosphohydrolase [Gammaproteobacteria bacterium]
MESGATKAIEASSPRVSKTSSIPTSSVLVETPDGGHLLDALQALLKEYLPEEQVAVVYRAYQFGARVHRDQHRASGEPYIHHPLAVARILAKMRLDHCTITAAILHDVIEDTSVEKEEIEAEFGNEIAELVDGVTKLTQIEFENKLEAEAENFRKMMLAMVRDIRVIIIKLADRLHNMRTLGALASHKRRRIAKETLEIYAPMANRLGMNEFRVELQDLGFQALYPQRYRILDAAIKRARGNRKEVIEKIDISLEQRLWQEGLQAKVEGREKHLYSIYQKMKEKHLSFSEVFDVYAFRVMVDTVDSCYRALGVMHHLYKPVNGRFKDYIAIPKANGYQSLHTILFGPYGVPVEMQIRTHDMNKVAEAGVAAHWIYKTSDLKSSGTTANIHEWMSGLLEMQQQAGDSVEFLENVKIDLFPDEVYVFSPKGKIMRLPRGSTAVDFAYSVHSDVGAMCVAAKLDRRLMPLSTPLVNGQTVEIITAPSAHPNAAWLNFVVTAKARSKIRHYLKNLRGDESVALGRRLLTKTLDVFSIKVEDIEDGEMAALLTDFNLESLESLYAEVGLGNRPPALVAKRIRDQLIIGGKQTKRWRRYVPNWLKRERSAGAPLSIKGTEGMVVNYGKCCRPIPGDRICAILTSGRGIVVHQGACKNAVAASKSPEKLLDVQWQHEAGSVFPVEVAIHARNRRGVLAKVAAVFSDMGANIDNIAVEDRDGKYSVLHVTVDVEDRSHLAKIMRKVKRVESVAKIQRDKHA